MSDNKHISINFVDYMQKYVEFKKTVEKNR